MINAAFVGGGLRSVKGLGIYSVLEEKQLRHFVLFSGASIGSVIAICLAAGKSPKGIWDFLADNVTDFGTFILGNKKIEQAVNEYLGYMRFEDLPMECLVSIAPVPWKNFPCIITRENAENLTVGKVAALSSSLPLLSSPRFAKLGGKHALIFDGGFLYNPPLNHEADENWVFSYRQNDNPPIFPWDKHRAKQEAKADVLFNPLTHYGLRGKREDVFTIYEEGRKCAMEFYQDL